VKIVFLRGCFSKPPNTAVKVIPKAFVQPSEVQLFASSNPVRCSQAHKRACTRYPGIHAPTVRSRECHEPFELSAVLRSHRRLGLGLIIVFAEALLRLCDRSYYVTCVHPVASNTNCASKKRQHPSACVSENKRVATQRKVAADKTVTAKKK